jgi:Putative Flp pilus-assembly TadE/G-like
MKRRSESGQILPLIAICLAALMGFAGISVDVAFLEYRQQTQQTATDAAAAGGAAALLKAGGCPNQSAANTAADQNAANNGFTNGTNNVTITVTNPPDSGPFQGSVCAVAVTLTTKHVATFFSKLFGYAGGMDETTHAVAIVSATGAGCIYLLSMTTSQNFNGDTVNASKCGILINDTANFNGATVNAYGIGYAGAAPNQNGAHFGEAPPAPMLPVADPCPEIAGCAYLAANPPPATNCGSVRGGASYTLSPGCYNDLNMNGTQLTLNPGLYVLNGSSNFNGATITGSGVTIYVTANATPPNFNGDTVTLSPPSTGNYQGVIYYQVPQNTQSPNFNGNNDTYSGLIYAPGGTSVNFNGNHSGYMVLVFGAVNFNGANAQDFATPPPEQSLVKTAVVAQ